MQSRTYELPFELFDAEDGFPGMAQRVRPIPTIIEGSDGRLWFAGTLNVGTLDPASIRRNTIPPPVAIRALTAGGRGFSTTDDLSLAAGTRDLQIDYTALSLSRPDRIRFRYRLDGFDENWVEAGSRRQAFYTNLDPGHYKFRVAAANESGIWNESGAALAIVIPPTFVQTRTFVALCVAARCSPALVRVRAARASADRSACATDSRNVSQSENASLVSCTTRCCKACKG